MKLSELIKSKIVFMWFLIAIWFIVWISTFLSIPKEPDPSIDLPMYVVNTVYPGWDPETIRQQISNKLEDEFKSISNVKKIESVSSFNVSTLIVEFYESKEKSDAINDLKTSIDSVQSDFPEGTLFPVIKQVSPSDSPIYIFSVVWNYVNKILYEKSQILEESLKWVQWVSEVNVIWEPEKNINIEIDYEKLNSYNLDITYVAQVLQNAYLKVPADKKLLSNSLYSYEVTTYNTKDIDTLIKDTLNLDILNTNSRRVKLSDIWKVYFEEKVDDQKSYILELEPSLDKNYTSYNAISFQIKMTPGEDLEKIIKEILVILDDFKEENTDLKIFEIESKWEQIDDMFWTFISNFRQTWVLILIFVLVFVWFRPSLAITITFPLVYLFVFIGLDMLWYTFNTIVSFSLVLTLWIMVDNLIVITEWIIEQYKAWEKNYWRALQKALDKFLIAVLAWTATTIVMFAPIYSWVSWMMWQYIRPLPVTITVTLVISLFVSAFLLPVVLSKFVKKDGWFKKTKWTIYLEKKAEKLWRFINHTLTTKKHSLWVVLLTWWALIWAFTLVGTWIVKSDFMPATDEDNVWVNVKYDSWISLGQNQEYSTILWEELVDYFNEKYPGHIKYIWLDLGTLKTLSAVAWASAWVSDNQSNFTLKFISWDDREVKSFVISEELQEYFNNVLKKKYSFIQDIYMVSWMSMSWWKPVWFYLVWDDILKLNDYYLSIKPELEKVHWMYNLSSNIEYTNWKIQYFIDPNKAKEYWISPTQWAYLLMGLKNSEYTPNWIKITEFSEYDKDAIDLNLFVKQSWDIQNLKVWSNYLENIIVSKQLQPELKSYQSIDAKMALFIEADKFADVPLGWISAEIEKIINDNKVPDGVKFRYNSNIEDQQSSMSELWTSFWLWIMFMLIVLVLQFNSIKYTIIILSSTILSFSWVLFVLPIFGLPLSFPAQLWLFWVIWVWVNNAILYMEAYIEDRNSWKEFKTSLVDAVKSRFISIFLTTATTVTWLVTLALKDEMWWSLAVAFIWWLLANVFIIFIYLPNLLHIFDHKEKK